MRYALPSSYNAVCFPYWGSLTLFRDLLFEAVRILEKSPQTQNRSRIARSKYKLSHILRELHDPRSEDFLSDARKLRAKAVPGDEIDGDANEATFNALVANL